MDMHCHLLWGVDDGAHILRDSLEIISRLKEKGFRGAYCTPHISSRYPSNTPARLKARFQQLLDALPDRDFDLRLAAEYMLDHHLNRRLRRKSRSATTAATCSWSFPSSAFPAPGGTGSNWSRRKASFPSWPIRNATGRSCLRRNWLPWPHRESASRGT